MHQFLTIDGLGVVQPKATRLAQVGGHHAGHLGQGHGGIEGGPVAGGLTIQTHAGRQGEILIDLPRVLQEQAQVLQRPRASGLLQRAPGHSRLNLVHGGSATLEVFQHRLLDLHGGGGVAGDGAEGVREGGAAVDAGKGVDALGVLQEGVEDLVAGQVCAKLQIVAAQRPIGAQVNILRIGLQDVEVAKSIGTKQQRACAGRDRRRRAHWQSAKEAQRHLRQIGVECKDTLVFA